MTDPLKGYISLQEAADLLGVSRPTVYRRALAAEQYMNSTLNSAEQPVNSKPASIVQGKKRYLSMDWVLAELDKAETVNSAEQPVNSKMNSAEQHMNSTLNSPQDRILQLEKDLLAAQGEAAALKATVAAQEAHIDTLKEALETEKGNSEGFKKALDQQQALHMASLQKRLPAGQGNTFMDWIRGRGKK